MLGVTFPGEREIALLEFPDPTPGPGEVVLEMRASGMCGSDLRAYRAPKDIVAFREIYKGLPTATMRDNEASEVGKFDPQAMRDAPKTSTIFRK